MENMVTISFYGPRELRDELDQWARQERRSRSNLLCLVLQPIVRAQFPRDINDEEEEE